MSPRLETKETIRGVRRIATRLFASVLYVFLILSSAAPWLGIDDRPWGLVFVYSSRMVLAFVLAIYAFVLGWRRRWAFAVLALAGVVFFVMAMGWGGIKLPDREGSLMLLAFNVYEGGDHAAEVAAVARQRAADIVCLQEVKRPDRLAYRVALSGYEVFFPENAPLQDDPSDDPDTGLIAVREGLLDKGSQVRIASSITGYRTFAMLVQINERPLWIVNVHCTKPIWLRGDFRQILIRADDKAQRHLDERTRLEQWIHSQAPAPMVLAGDFNAPAYTRGARLHGFDQAHQQVGIGPHLTFPTAIPIIGIDHVLANERLQLLSYDILWPGVSDHGAQLCRFVIR